MRANRVECVGAMMAESGKLERAYSFTRDYGKVYSGTLNDSKLTSCPLDTNGSTSANKQTYTVTVNSTKTTYTIVAIPIGRQAQDSCGGLALTHLGEKKSGVSDSTGASAAHNNDAIAAACWR
ncbi:MAG: type IV pilin protein [Zoogloeaceae bacterium]|nr:type IV pilin protein [Zoogloeaceae bacterium]